MNNKDSAPFLTERPLKHLNKVVKRATLDVEFQDVKYFVEDFGKKTRSKQILRSVTGKFCSGECSAILGPSGAGKTTLLNILTGYVHKGVEGQIKINNENRDAELFNKVSSYIMQENIVQPHLSVNEAMIYAARLKLGSNVKYEDQVAVVEEVIQFLGLSDCAETRSEHLSGGQRKRLTIALELVNNPAVIFLDEPTTGLDDFALKQCIDLLKKISRLDRTVVCAIHQPSSLLFHSFDQVYVLADGRCVYNGSPNQLVPFLSLGGYLCPSSYNPADYIIELVHSSSSKVETLTAAIQNGKINMKDTNERNAQTEILLKRDTDFPVSFLSQLYLLLSRMFLQTRRNKVSFALQFFCSLFAAFTFGNLFYKIGSNASHGYQNFHMCFAVNLFFAFTFSKIPVLVFPAEIPLLKREYFNCWYDLKAYYVALTIISLLSRVIYGLIFLFIIYWMSDQPMELDRLFGFCLISLMIGATSQAMGYLIGSIFNSTAGALIDSTVLGILVLFPMYELDYQNELPSILKFFGRLSYLRLGTFGLIRVISYEREPLECQEIFCYFSRLELFFEKSKLSLHHYKYDLGYIFLYYVFLQTMAFLTLKFRLSPEIYSKILRLVQTITKS